MQAVTATSNSFGVTRPSFLLSYQEVRCFKEKFYEGSTLDLYIEIQEDAIKDWMVKDPNLDGIRFHIVAPEPEYSIIHR